jgi:outer membrane protein OmpA-like peptidoglycan-associated protein
MTHRIRKNVISKQTSLTLFWVIQVVLFSQTAFGQSNEVKTLYFGNNSFTIESKYLPTLNEIGKWCETDTFSYLKIFAYADRKGTKKYNEQLSERRANAVYDYLTQKFSIDTAKIYVTWLGEETDGAYDLHFPSARVQQRCVDILVFFKKPE